MKTKIEYKNFILFSSIILVYFQQPDIN